jgi:hypothetical protein
LTKEEALHALPSPWRCVLICRCLPSSRPQRYRFRVKSENESGSSSCELSPVSVIIPPFPTPVAPSHVKEASRSDLYCSWRIVADWRRNPARKQNRTPREPGSFHQRLEQLTLPQQPRPLTVHLDPPFGQLSRAVDSRPPRRPAGSSEDSERIQRRSRPAGYAHRSGSEHELPALEASCRRTQFFEVAVIEDRGS